MGRARPDRMAGAFSADAGHDKADARADGSSGATEKAGQPILGRLGVHPRSLNHQRDGGNVPVPYRPELPSQTAAF